MFYNGWDDGFQGESMRKPITVLYESDKKAEAVLIAKMLYAHQVPCEFRECEDSSTKGAHLILAGGFGDHSLCTSENLFVCNCEEVKQLLQKQKQGELLVSEKPLQKPVDFALLHRLHAAIQQQSIAHGEYWEERYPGYSPYADVGDNVPYDDDDDRDVAYAAMLRAEKTGAFDQKASRDAYLDEQLERIVKVQDVLCKLYENACSPRIE